MKIYKVIRTDFDTLENRDPFVTTRVGIFKIRKKAEEAIEKNRTSNKIYKGWDDKEYPIYKIVEMRIK